MEIPIALRLDTVFQLADSDFSLKRTIGKTGSPSRGTRVQAHSDFALGCPSDKHCAVLDVRYQESAHPSLHGLYKHDSDSVTSSASDQGALFDMSSPASTCTVPHKSEFSVPSRWMPMLISHKEHVRYLCRIWKRMQNSV